MDFRGTAFVAIVALTLFAAAVSGQFAAAEGECRLVTCFVNPCRVASCPAYASAECIPNYCNSCSANFYIRGIKLDQQDCLGAVNRGDLKPAPKVMGQRFSPSEQKMVMNFLKLLGWRG